MMIRTGQPFIFRNKTIYFKWIRKYDLIVFDDILPVNFSGFRKEELMNYTSHFENSKLFNHYSRRRALLHKYRKSLKIKAKRSLIEELFQSIGIQFVNVNTRLFYCLFLNNIYLNLYWIKKFKTNFIFTLYPGGGFFLDDEVSDMKLRLIFESPFLKKVIITQHSVLDYVNRKFDIAEDKIEFIFGGVVPQISINKVFNLKSFETINICFCGAKNSAFGEDKGYDVYLEVMNHLLTNYDFVRGVVIGGFEDSDGVVFPENLKKIDFHGYLDFNELSEVFENCHIILSPNKLNVLNNGSFDGFPNGCTIEAVLNGCVAIVSDNLDENKIFRQYEDLIISKPDASDFIEIIEKLLLDQKLISKISHRGRESFKSVYSNKNQLSPRLALLKRTIRECES